MTSFPIVLVVVHVLVTLCGFALIYIALWMKKKQRIHSVILAPEELARCNDESGFVAFLYGKLLITAAFCLVSGAYGMVLDFANRTNILGKSIVLLLFLTGCGIYAVSIRKARDNFLK